MRRRPRRASSGWAAKPKRPKATGLIGCATRTGSAVGRLRNGGTAYVGPAVIDLAYLLGENGGHMNVNGIAGLGAKSSFLLHVIDLLMRWAKHTRKARRRRSAPSSVPIIFNVKNFDLFFIDRWNRNWQMKSP